MQPRAVGPRRFKLAVVVALVALSALTGCDRGLGRIPADPQDGRPLGRGTVVVYSSKYEVDLLGMELSSTFDVHKCMHVAEALISDGYLATDDLLVPPEVTRDELLLVHTAEYLDALQKPSGAARHLDQKGLLLLSAGTIDRRILSAFRRATGGTVLAARRAVANGMAFNLGGGYHHAHPDRGMGACVYADVPVAVRVLQRDGLVRRVLVVDCNVHHGNGLAICFAGDEDVFTLSLHETDLWPDEKPPNDLDVGLKLPVDDAAYMAALEKSLPEVVRGFQPELVVFIAGADVVEGDPNGHFSLTPEGIVRRDEYVARLVRSAEIPLLYLLGGGYSPTAWQIQAASIGNLLEKLAGAAPRPTDSGEAPSPGVATSQPQ